MSKKKQDKDSVSFQIVDADNLESACGPEFNTLMEAIDTFLSEERATYNSSEFTLSEKRTLLRYLEAVPVKITQKKEVV